LPKRYQLSRRVAFEAGPLKIGGAAPWQPMTVQERREGSLRFSAIRSAGPLFQLRSLCRKFARLIICQRGLIAESRQDDGKRQNARRQGVRRHKKETLPRTRCPPKKISHGNSAPQMTPNAY
jgi:hypothetical protein